MNQAEDRFGYEQQKAANEMGKFRDKQVAGEFNPAPVEADKELDELFNNFWPMGMSKKNAKQQLLAWRDKAVLEAKVKMAAEMSSLDQEIIHLKSQLNGAKDEQH